MRRFHEKHIVSFWSIYFIRLKLCAALYLWGAFVSALKKIAAEDSLGRGWKGGTRYDRSNCGLELKAVWANPLTHLWTHLSSTHNKTNGSLLCKSSLFVQRSSATLNWASYLLKLVPCDVVLVWWTSNKQAWFAFILKFLICSYWNETAVSDKKKGNPKGCL